MNEPDGFHQLVYFVQVLFSFVFSPPSKTHLNRKCSLTINGRLCAISGEVVEAVAEVDQVPQVVSRVGELGSVLPYPASPSVGERHKLAQETCT